MGHKNPSGDMVGSLLALGKALKTLEKNPEVVISDNLPGILEFLPDLGSVTKNYQALEGKIIRVDTKKIPVAGMKVQKADDYLDIILDAAKNLKFEFLNILNGLPKPDLIIVLDTADVEKIDKAYDENTELFFEAPVVNIDHHAGNEYFGSVNLVDLTATSTAEILVSLFEALGIKISDPDIATCLLTGITSDTQSFRAQNTTPKSLTVAAQLLANGARQQEIVTNLYKQRPMSLLKLWGKMLSGIEEDKNHRFAWAKVKLSEVKEVSKDEVFEAADELLSNTPDADVLLILCETDQNRVIGKLKGSRGINVLPIAELFGGKGTNLAAEFSVEGKSLDYSEKWVLKKLFDFWGESAPEPSAEKREVWNLIEKEATGVEDSTKQPKTPARPAGGEKPNNKKELSLRGVEDDAAISEAADRHSKVYDDKTKEPEGNGYIESKRVDELETKKKQGDEKNHYIESKTISKSDQMKPDYAISGNDADVIESALKSLAENETPIKPEDESQSNPAERSLSASGGLDKSQDKGFASLKEVIEKKKGNLKPETPASPAGRQNLPARTETERSGGEPVDEDVFEEED